MAVKCLCLGFLGLLLLTVQGPALSLQRSTPILSTVPFHRWVPINQPVLGRTTIFSDQFQPGNILFQWCLSLVAAVPGTGLFA